MKQRSSTVQDRPWKPWLEPVLLSILAAALTAFLWLKLTDLTAGDSVRWFLEAHRAASGEMPYRDFSWLYPPAGLWPFVLAFKLFGSSFAAIQVVLDLLSWAACLLLWNIARKPLPRAIALATAALFAVAGASNTNNFALFSLNLYAPGLLTGVVGLLLFLGPLVDRLCDDQCHSLSISSFSWIEGLSIVGGATLACLSKLEIAVAVAGASAIFPALLLVREKKMQAPAFLRSAIGLGLAALGPSIIFLLLLALRAGVRQTLEALGGYGVGGLTCPWWPTGIGLLSIVGTLSRALVLAGLLSLLRFRALLADYGRRYLAFLGAASVAAVLACLLLSYSLSEFANSQPKGMSRTLLLARYMLSLTSVLHPVMWVGIAYLALSGFRIARGRSIARAAFPWLLIIAVGMLASSRSLFGDLFSRVSGVFASSYPMWFLVAAIIALELLRRIGGALAAHRTTLVSIAILLYGGARLVSMYQSYRGILFTSLETEAGPVRLRDFEHGAAMYEAVQAQTKPGDRILEVPFGGGLVFASQRKSSLFLTQFVGLAPSGFIEEIDKNKLLAAPPHLVIANRAPKLGAGKGVALGCGFPHFMFAPPDHDPQTEPEQPSLAMIQANYRVVQVIGDREFLVPVSPLAH